MAKRERSSEGKIVIYLDTVTNSVISKGISLTDFMHGIGNKRLPSALLLLNSKFDVANLNPHTKFSFIDEGEKTKALAIALEKQTTAFSWLDFEEEEMLNQLTGQEIAEILYLGHRGTHLRSPFYYKLQNEYVYLTLDEGERNKVYYRDITRFYEMLAAVITMRVNAVQHKKSLFGKIRPTRANKLPVGLIRTLRPLLKEGCVFDFGLSERTKTEVRIPIIIKNSDDDSASIFDEEMTEVNIEKWLTYSLKNDEWSLK
ncbi:hypothetical protein [Brochothrix campestris]|uniref:Uncharacterized protein n=1 Tax=Brochothrix campestris FSL F6-1037 TaxID=1265861 RepID=W7CX88_9LIST|nr:hypothetical protein [Brochothrix campestris]EUJ40371.1 hypothetical protein BCAMP_05439 [Brochothrix campestris FSL F6-1037]